MQKFLIIAGILIIAAGLCWPWLAKIPFGHLPVDIVIDRPGFKLFIPVTTMLLLSALISIIIWLVRKF